LKLVIHDAQIMHFRSHYWTGLLCDYNTAFLARNSIYA